MRDSIFSTLGAWLKDVYRGIRSVLGSVTTAFPYLVNAGQGELHKEMTEQYPDPVSSRTPDDLPPRTRGLLYNDIDRCTGCRECEKVCPVGCVTVETEPGTDSSKIWVGVFDIDFARCIFCGLCVESCTPQSLIHTKQYEGSVYLLPDLVASFGRGRVTPEQRKKWAQARALADDEENMKL